MALSPGTRLGAYEIVSLLGRGGMGEVYRARDTRLDRIVAVKVLSADVAADPDRRARFEREARAIAALSHPHICTIHDVGRHERIDYLVMEHLEGETLADRLTHAHGPLPLEQVLTIGIAIADALDKAHRSGIVHRDLKPANVMLTKTGAKLLDFGLAKLRGPVVPITMSALTAPPAPATATGTILGTIQYMAPEQVEGREADTRSDIWALGAVLYEMATGTRPFDGASPASVIGAILKDTPPSISTRQPLAPPILDHVVARCLARDPDERWQTASDLKRDLKWIEGSGPPPRAATSDGGSATGRSINLSWLVAAAASALLAATVPAAWRLWRQAPAEARRVVRLELNLPPNVDLYSISGAPISLSPDGNLLAFSGTEQTARVIYVRALDQPEAKVMRGTELGTSPFFSFDNTVLGVIASDSTLKKVSLNDGLVATLASAVDFNSGGALGPNGRVLFVRNGTLWEMRASGGTPKQLTTLDTQRHEIAHQWPVLLPGGHAVLYTSLTTGSLGAPRIEALTLADGKRKSVVGQAAFPIYAATGHLLFLRDGALLAVPFDAGRLEQTGDAVRIVENVAVTGSGAPIAAVADNGTFVYAPAAARAGRLVSVNRQGAETTITDVSRTYTSPRLSPDGRRIVVVSEGNALWLQDTTRQVFTRLTPSEINTAWPIWTRDGQRVWYRTMTGLHWIQADGSGRTGTIPGTTDYRTAPGSISPDGETLAYLYTSPETGSGDIYVLSLHGDPRPRALVNTAAYEGGPQFSKDGRWIAYASNESGRFQIYVRPFPGPDRRVQVSTDGGSFPVWNPKGSELFYRSGNQLMAVQITTGSQDVDPIVSAPRMLFDEKYGSPGNTMPGYDVSADGEHFVFVREDSAANRLNVVLNWFEELKARVPTK